MKSRKAHILLLIIAFVSLVTWAGGSFGYEVDTHRRINNAVSDKSLMDEYFSAELLRPLDAKGRIADMYQGKFPFKIFEEAGVDEDSPNTWCWPIPLPPTPYLFVSNSFEGTISAIPTATPPAAAAQGAMATAASSSEDPGLGLALLRGFPPGCRVYADGEIPRREAQFEEGLSVSFPSKTRELFLFCPGYRNRAVPVSVGPGETVVLDGQLLPE